MLTVKKCMLSPAAIWHNNHKEHGKESWMASTYTTFTRWAEY